METDAEIIVLCSLGLAGVMAELQPQFERANAKRLALRIDTTNALKKEIENGAAFDVAILTAPVIDDLIRQGRIAAGTRADIARSWVGVTVPPDAPPPDIGTVDAFKRALLAAKSIIFTGQGASGQHFARLLPRLGIEEEILRKAVIPDGGLVAEAVVRGEVEMGIQQVSEILAVPGAVLVGPIPAELQNYTVFSAGLGAHARSVPAAKTLIARLTDADTLALATARGMEAVLEQPAG